MGVKDLGLQLSTRRSGSDALERWGFIGLRI